VLLLSWEMNAGLRQTYFNSKRLHFSRLIPISSSSSFSESVAAETPRTQQYLRSLSLPPPGEVLDVYIICHANDQHALQARLESSSDLNYSYLDIQQLGNRIKAKNGYSNSDATPLLLHLLADKPPRSHYADSEHTHVFLLWQLRWLLFGLAAATMLVSALWSGAEFFQARDFVAETEPLNIQAEHVKQQTQQIQHGFANTGIPAADMKTAVMISRKLRLYTPPAEEYLRGLTLVLNKFTQIKVDKLSWQSSAAEAAPSAYPAQIISLDGNLAIFGNDFRKALDYLDRFQQALAQQGYTVTAQKLPLDITSKGSLSGDAKSAEGSAAKFTLKIIWRQKE
jgi:hypothetical protein